MGAIKNYLISHPELREHHAFDEGYVIRKQEEAREQQQFEEERVVFQLLIHDPNEAPVCIYDGINIDAPLNNNPF